MTAPYRAEWIWQTLRAYLVANLGAYLAAEEAHGSPYDTTAGLVTSVDADDFYPHRATRPYKGGKAAWFNVLIQTGQMLEEPHDWLWEVEIQVCTAGRTDAKYPELAMRRLWRYEHAIHNLSVADSIDGPQLGQGGTMWIHRLTSDITEPDEDDKIASVSLFFDLHHRHTE